MQLANYFIFVLAVFATSFSQIAFAENTISRIAFGSCAKQNKPQPIWEAVLADKPDAFVFLGDNIYGDSTRPHELKDKYQQLATIPGFQQLRASTPVFATWDDHDYGQNDAGVENPIKNESRKLMLDFWNVPDDSPRRTQEGGIYTSYYFGEGDRRIQLLMLDLRWNRTPLKKGSFIQQWISRFNHRGPYQPQTADDAIFLGEAQWQWLEQELQNPAKLRILASSLQLAADFTGWEAWANYPKDLSRLHSIINQHHVNGLLVISGDTHWAEISRVDNKDLPYPLYDVTSSGLTETWHPVSPNQFRISDTVSEANYGLIEIQWDKTPIIIDVKIKNVEGKTLLQQTLSLDELQIDDNIDGTAASD